MAKIAPMQHFLQKNDSISHKAYNMNFIKRIFKSFVRGPIYITLFGSIFFGIGAGLAYKQWTLEHQGIHTQGEVLGFSTSCDDEGCSYAPVVRITTQNGQEISVQTTYYSNPPAYDTGQIVQVIYPSENPEKAVVEDQGQAFRIIFMLVGGVVIALGLFVFAVNIKSSYMQDTQ